MTSFKQELVSFFEDKPPSEPQDGVRNLQQKPDDPNIWEISNAKPECQALFRMSPSYPSYPSYLPQTRSLPLSVNKVPRYPKSVDPGFPDQVAQKGAPFSEPNMG